MNEGLHEITAETILSAGVAKLQSFGITFRKVEYFLDFADKVQNGNFDLQGISLMSNKVFLLCLILKQSRH